MEFPANERYSEVHMRCKDDDSGLRSLRNLSSVACDQGYFLRNKYGAVTNSQDSLFNDEI